MLIYNSCRHDEVVPEGDFPVICTIMPPSNCIGSAEAPATLDWRGKIDFCSIPSLARRETGARDIWAPVSMMQGVRIGVDGWLGLLVWRGTSRPRSVYDLEWSVMLRDNMGLVFGGDCNQPS